jgi:4-hydroxy-3-polyprenylbenzoate decarboxylase
MLEGIDDAECLVDAAAERKVVHEFVPDDPVLVDQVKAAERDHLAGSSKVAVVIEAELTIEDAVSGSDDLVGVGEERVGDALDAALIFGNLEPAPVRLFGVRGACDQFNVPFFEFGEFFLKRVEFRGADEGEILRVKKQDHVFFSVELLEIVVLNDLVAFNHRGGAEVGSFFSDKGSHGRRGNQRCGAAAKPELSWELGRGLNLARIGGMAYRSLKECLVDLERNGQLHRVGVEVDPYLELAEIQRRAYQAGAPALLFERVKGTAFPVVTNLYGTLDRARFIFRDTLEAVRQAIQLKADPTAFLKAPHRFLKAPWAGLHSLPVPSLGKAPVLWGRTTVDQLPLLTSWPMDGGPYITLPQVYTEDPLAPGVMRSNVGMYRVQMLGNDYVRNQEMGLHYQIHRGIGVHHSRAARRGEKLRVSVFVGGPPAHALGAVMPLPEGVTELLFNGMLAGRNFRYARVNGHLVSSDADFCIVGTVDPVAVKPEGPFGDHLGYYSLRHEFPVLEVEAVYHRRDAVWPLTVVGRPPQEDTTFGALIHELAQPMVPVSVPGLVSMHAVDAAGVHPLLLAVGHERYVPYARERVPQEILTVANAVLGFGQASLAKYLWIAAEEDAPGLDPHDVRAFFRHMLERVDFSRDLHFQTRTTMDTLDYSGTAVNEGSKLVVAAAGTARRRLGTELPAGFRLPGAVRNPRFCMEGVLALEAAPGALDGEAVCEELGEGNLEGIALVLLVDDSAFAARTLNNWVWVVFTRSNPSHDVYGVGSFTRHKHWGCTGPLVIDARIKPHHAPPLVEDAEVIRRVDALCAKGGALHSVLAGA